jgi:putative FmdB family regulatory protein
MPTYGYRCTSCENTFERVQKITEPALTECESCGGALKKLIYPVGIQFVGSGFYVNDYSKSSGRKSSAKSEGDNGNGAGSSSSAESKPAETKSEASASAPAAAGVPATS